VARRSRRLEYACKPAVPALLIAAALALESSSEAQRAWLVAALALALAGDVFLMLPRDLFVAGLAAFLLAHLAYVAGFQAAGVSGGELARAAAVIALAAVLLAARLLPAAAPAEPGVGPPVALYSAAIWAMVAHALTASPVAGAGAVLFMGSDALIAWNRFLRPLAWAPLAIIVTYHLAQALLTVSLTA
jgi:uncharacterized membrane protein YhhN